jgi:hypothetical protein
MDTTVASRGRHVMSATGSSQGTKDRTRYLWGAAVVWAAIWIGTAVVLQGGGDFVDMIPILVVGTGWFVAVVPAQWGRPDDRGSGRGPGS